MPPKHIVGGTADETRKRKVEDKNEDGPAKKEAKHDVKKGDADVQEAEKEKDAPADKRPSVKDTISFDPRDCTLNVLPAVGGRALMALTDGGMQYLIAGARANVGMKAGRYLYELRIIEALNCEARPGARGRTPVPKQLVRVGFSIAGSSLVLGEDEGGVCFDSEGAFHALCKKSPVSQRFTRDHIIAVLLNLDPKSPNKSTISLFRDGQRVSEPQPLPEVLHGKTLFPHVSFRNVTVQLNFGPQVFRSLPFKCRLLQGAAAADVEVAPPSAPKGGKYEVLMPVALPDEGTFDWLDGFLKTNPQYVELSDRKILDWACKSGFWKPKGGITSSRDKPEFNFGVPEMDDLSVRSVINAVAPVVPRNYVIMEVRANLMEADRAETLQRFNLAHYNKIAHVVVGEPSDEYKKIQQQGLLKEKQEKAMQEWTARKTEKEKKKAMALKQKQLVEMRKKADEAKKKAAEEAARKVEEARKQKEEEEKKREEQKKAKEAEENANQGVEAKEGDDVRMEDVKEGAKEEVKDEVKDEVKEETQETKVTETTLEPKEENAEEAEEADEPEPVVELSDEDKKVWFRASEMSDMAPLALSKFFGNFTLPEKSEGFDEVRFEWFNAEESEDYLKKWILEKKQNTRMEDLQPSQWFKDKLSEWRKKLLEWQQKQKTFKAARAAKKEAKAKKDQENKDAADGQDSKKDDDDEEKEDVDIFSVEDVCNVGNDEPLFGTFGFEDWALLQLRFELHLLLNAFRRDANDPDRVGVNDQHFAFYYNKYYQKQISPKYYGVGTNKELVDLVKDSVKFSPETKVLTSPLQEDMDSFDIFVKLAEESRRERQRRIDAGDETARLKFSPLVMQQPQPQTAKPPPSKSAVNAVPPAASASAGTGTGVSAATPPRPAAWVPTRPAQTPPPGFGGVRPPPAATWRPPPGAGRAAWTPTQAYAPRAPFQQKW